MSRRHRVAYARPELIDERLGSINVSAKQPHPLEVVMIDRGLSHAGVAALCRAVVAEHGLRSGNDRNLVWKWKAGRQTPTAESQRNLAEALGVPGDVLAEHDWPDWLWHAVTGPAQVLQPPWSTAGTRRVLHKVAGCGMDKRKFLVITGPALTGLGTSWGAGLTDDSVEQIMIESSVGGLTSEVLDRVDGTLAGLRHRDDVFGGGELRRVAFAEFRWLTDLAGSTVHASATERRLFGLITEAARLCGWCHFDANYHAAAQTFYVVALRASASAQDPLAGAHVLACMSFQAMLTGHHQEAISLIDSAEEQLRRTGTPRLKALLASRKARAYAKSGQARACGRALNDAETQLDRARPDGSEPDWIYYFDEAELAAQAGACWIDLHQPARARPLIDKALTTIDADYVRDRTIYHARNAQVYTQEDEFDLACRELITAVVLGQQTGSVRSIDTIRQARENMSRYDREVRMRELDHRLAALAI